MSRRTEWRRARGTVLLAAAVLGTAMPSAGAPVKFTGRGVFWGRPGLTPNVITLPGGVCHPGWGWSWNGGWWGWDSGWGWRNTTWRGPSLIEVVRREDPAILGEPVMPATPVDAGLAALASGDFDRAVVVYAERFAEQSRVALDDKGEPMPLPGTRWEQRRLMAVALVGARRLEEAVAAFTEASAADASLRERALDTPALLGSTMKARRLVTSMVEHAHRAGTPEAWEAVAVLMQGEGRLERALAMRERAAAIRASRGGGPVN